MTLQRVISCLQLSVWPDASESQQQPALVLQAALESANSELQMALQQGPGCSAPSGQLEDVRLMLLLEKYSDQLVQVTRDKLSRL